MDGLTGILIIAGTSTTKYLAGIALGIYYMHSQDWNFITYYLSTVIGGMVGVVAYDLLLLEIIDFVKRKRGIEKRFRMNKRMRRLVRIRSKFGLIGIAALTPIILQVPVGTILAGTIEQNSKKVALYMFVSFSFYSVLFYGLNVVFDFNPNSLIEALQFWK